MTALGGWLIAVVALVAAIVLFLLVELLGRWMHPDEQPGMWLDGISKAVARALVLAIVLLVLVTVGYVGVLLARELWVR